MAHSIYLFPNNTDSVCSLSLHFKNVNLLKKGSNIEGNDDIMLYKITKQHNKLKRIVLVKHINYNYQIILSLSILIERKRTATIQMNNVYNTLVYMILKIKRCLNENES